MGKTLNFASSHPYGTIYVLLGAPLFHKIQTIQEKYKLLNSTLIFLLTDVISPFRNPVWYSDMKCNEKTKFI